MNKQQAFDKIWKHFVVKGGKRSVQSAAAAKAAAAADPAFDLDTPACLYRGPNRARCAVGVLLPDDVVAKLKKKYPKDWNYKQIQTLLGIPAVKRLFRDMGDDGDRFLADAQLLHDDKPVAPVAPARFQAHMRAGLKSLAKSYGLDVPKAAPKAK